MYTLNKRIMWGMLLLLLFVALLLFSRDRSFKVLSLKLSAQESMGLKYGHASEELHSSAKQLNVPLFSVLLE